MKTTAKRDWTVLLYQGNGCYGKFWEHHNDLKELEKVATGDRVTFVSQGHTDYKEDKLARREIKPTDGFYPSEPVKVVKGRQTSRKQLADFVRWGMKEYPAEHTCLVISGYAGGYTGIMADKNKGLMSLPDVRRGLESGLGGEKLDVLAFDGHWMASAEVAAEFGGLAEFMVASQERMDSWKYDESFAGLAKNTKLDPEDLALSLMRADSADSGMSVYDLDESANVEEWSRHLCETVENHRWEHNPISQAEGVSHFRDLGSICERFEDRECPEDVAEVACELEDAIGDMVVAHQPRHNKHTTGMNVATYYEPEKRKQEFNQRTGWGEMVEYVKRSVEGKRG